MNGLSSEEIDVIQNYQDYYRSHVESLNELDDETLAGCGYTEDQIEIIRNFTGTESELMAVSAEMDLYSTTALFRYEEGDFTTGRLAYNWSWSGLPVIKYNDLIAVSWNEWSVTDETSYISYYYIGNGQTDYYGRGEATLTYPDSHESSGAGHAFSMTMTNNNYFAKAGGGTFDIESDGAYQKNFYYWIEYDHFTVDLTPSFDISIGGSEGSIGISVGYSCAASDRGSYHW